MQLSLGNGKSFDKLQFDFGNNISIFLFPNGWKNKIKKSSASGYPGHGFNLDTWRFKSL